MEPDYHLVISGGRRFTNYAAFFGVLAEHILTLSGKGIQAERIVIVEGGAPGTDALAKRFAESIDGLRHRQFPAAWGNLDAPGAVIRRTRDGRPYNAKAGHDRNLAMRVIAQEVIAFWDGISPGTGEMVKACEKAKIPLTLISYNAMTGELLKPSDLIPWLDQAESATSAASRNILHQLLTPPDNSS